MCRSCFATRSGSARSPATSVSRVLPDALMREGRAAGVYEQEEASSQDVTATVMWIPEKLMQRG